MLSEPIEITHKAIDMTDSGEPKTEVVENADGNKTIMPVLGNRTTKDVYTTVSREVKTEDVDIYNSGFTRQLLPHTAENNDNPEQYSATIKIVTSQQANEQTTDNMNYDNLIEYAMYSNTVGRRDMQTIPGNANMIAKEQPQYWAGYEKVAEKAQDGTVTGYKFQAKQTTINDKSGTATTILTERDAYAPKDTITFSEPTGLSLERQRTNTIIRIILTSLIIAAITIMTATVVVVLKKTKKYDDKDLLDTNEKN